MHRGGRGIFGFGSEFVTAICNAIENDLGNRIGIPLGEGATPNQQTIIDRTIECVHHNIQVDILAQRLPAMPFERNLRRGPARMSPYCFERFCHFRIALCRGNERFEDSPAPAS